MAPGKAARQAEQYRQPAVHARGVWRKGRGMPLWADQWLAGALNDEIYDDEEWPVEEVPGREPVD